MPMLRQGTLTDSAAMAEIFNHYVAESTVIFSNDILSADDMLRRMEPVSGNYPWFVTQTDDGLLTGYCYAHPWHPNAVYGRTLEITIYIREGFTGRGYGRRLLGAVMEECRKEGYHVLISCITDGNESCERLHSAMGFTRAGVLPEVGYKFDRFLGDAIYYKIL